MFGYLYAVSAIYEYQRDVLVRTQKAAVARRCATKQSTHLPIGLMATFLPSLFVFLFSVRKIVTFHLVQFHGSVLPPLRSPSPVLLFVIESAKTTGRFSFFHWYTSPNFLIFKEPKNLFQGTYSARLCSLAGRYYNPIPTRPPLINFSSVFFQCLAYSRYVRANSICRSRYLSQGFFNWLKTI